jgi:DNA-binding HxlR family transcriptional regulator
VTSRYGQYCPLSLATELLGERWTILVVMQVAEGVHRFSDLQRALPRISPSTLSSRLRSLEEAELIERRSGGDGDGVEYHVTRGGKALEPILGDLAMWGQRWARDLEPDDLDPEFLAWSLHKRLDTDVLPPGRTVVEFEFTGVPRGLCRRFWILVEDERVEVCIQHPGHETDLRVCSDLQRFVDAWRGFRPLDAELAAGRIRLEGPRELCRAFPRLLLLSIAAPTPRERPGREREVSRRRAGTRRPRDAS